MKFIELAQKRQSIRDFQPNDVPLEKVRALLHAARFAPSGGNCQPWHFHAVKDAALKAQIAAFSGGNRPFIVKAPVLVVVCADLERSGGRYGERGKTLYALQDTAAAVQNILLCAADEGLASCWCGSFDEKGVSGVLNLDEGLRPVALLPIGYEAGMTPKTPRRPLEEVATLIGF